MTGTKVPLGQKAREVSSSLGEPGWLLQKRLEAVALLEKRKGSAEVSGFRMARGKMKVAVKCEGNATVLSIADALEKGNALQEQLGKKLTGHEPDGYLLSLALFTQATVVAAGAGGHARVFLDIGGKAPEYFAIFFLFADDSRASVFARTSLSSSSDGCFSLFVGKGAETDFVRLQQNGKRSKSSLSLSARLGDGSALRLLGSNLGSLESREGISILQEGRGSRCEHYEASLASGRQRFWKQSDHLHLAPGTYSRSVLKYATAGQALVDLDGKVTIEHEAPGSDTHLLARSLLLSDNALSHVVPQLFVRNDEVSAGHGSSMAPLDPEEFFYLQSRGIGIAEAKRLVLQGFLGEVLEKSGIDHSVLSPLRAELEKGALGTFPGD